MHRYGCYTCTYIHATYFAHLSFLPFFFSHQFWYYRRSRALFEREFGYIPNPDRYGVILGKPWILQWSIHILSGHTDNSQVPAILPARLDAVRSSYFRLALENRVSIICRLKGLNVNAHELVLVRGRGRHSRSTETC